MKSAEVCSADNFTPRDGRLALIEAWELAEGCFFYGGVARVFRFCAAFFATVFMIFLIIGGQIGLESG